jgi:hypothetical protein
MKTVASKLARRLACKSNVEIMPVDSTDEEYLMKHVNRLAYARYSHFSYIRNHKSLTELMKASRPASAVFDESSRSSEKISPSAISKLADRLLSPNLTLSLPSRTAIIMMLAFVFKASKKIELTKIDPIVKKNPFLYENLSEFDSSGARLSNREAVNVVMHLNEFGHYEETVELMELIQPELDALELLFVDGQYPGIETINVTVYFNQLGKDQFTGNARIQHEKAEKHSRKELNINFAGIFDEQKILNDFSSSDVQVLPETASQLSMASAILHPAKLVLVSRKNGLCLRNWTRY